MRNSIFFTAIIMISFGIRATSAGEAGKESNPAPGKKHIALVNLNNAATNKTMERLEKYSEKELRIQTDTVEKDMSKDLALAECAAKFKEMEDLRKKHPIVVAFYSRSAEKEHIYTTESKQITVINTVPLETDDSEMYARRLERLMMRGAGKAAGLGFDPDPHCVMHSYSKIEDLDRMGRNFSPPWQAMFNRAAERMGLKTVPFSTPSGP